MTSVRIDLVLYTRGYGKGIKMCKELILEFLLLLLNRKLAFISELRIVLILSYSLNDKLKFKMWRTN